MINFSLCWRLLPLLIEMSVTSARRNPPHPISLSLSSSSLLLCSSYVLISQFPSLPLSVLKWSWLCRAVSPSFHCVPVNPNPVASLLFSSLTSSSRHPLSLHPFRHPRSHSAPLILPLPLPLPPFSACISLCPSFHSLRYELCATSLPHERIILDDE